MKAYRTVVSLVFVLSVGLAMPICAQSAQQQALGGPLVPNGPPVPIPWPTSVTGQETQLGRTFTPPYETGQDHAKEYHICLLAPEC
jgi:hypothetical protein